MARALATAAFGVAMALAAATVDTPSLYVPGVSLIVIAVGAGAWVWMASLGARITRRPGPHTVEEEAAWPLQVEVRAGLLPPPGGELLEPLLGWPVPVGGRWRQGARINIRFERRGRRRLEPALLVVRDPLRLCERRVEGAGGEEVLVLPRVEPVRTADGSGGGGAGRTGLTGRDREAAGRALEGSTAELELDSLRPYREGSPASRIHWPAVARTGEMLERRLIADADSAPLVVLDARSGGSEEHLDMAVRAAASLCLHLARRGGCAVLLPGDRRPTELDSGLASWPAVHARLAVVSDGAPPPSLSRAARAGAVFWVTGMPAARAPRGLQRLAAGTRCLVTPVPAAGRRVEFTVAGCSGQVLGRAGRRPARAPAAAGEPT
jgi:uncharacterized protein (DUF58 family)